MEKTISAYFEANKEQNVSEMTIDQIASLKNKIAAFMLESCKNKIMDEVSNMTLSQLIHAQEAVKQTCNQPKQENTQKTRLDILRERAAYARKCKMEKLAKRKQAEAAAETSGETDCTKRKGRKPQLKTVELYEAPPKSKNIYYVYDRKDGKRTNVLYAIAPKGVSDKTVRCILKKSYALKTGVNYMNVSCRKPGSNRRLKMSPNAKRY